MKYMLKREGLYLMGFKPSGIKLTERDTTVDVLTGLYGLKQSDAFVFDGEYAASDVARRLGGAEMVPVEGGTLDENQTD